MKFGDGHIPGPDVTTTTKALCILIDFGYENAMQE